MIKITKHSIRVTRACLMVECLPLKQHVCFLMYLYHDLLCLIDLARQQNIEILKTKEWTLFPFSAGPSRPHKSYPGIPRPRDDDSCKGFPTTTNGQKFGLRAYLGFLFLNQGTPSRPHEHRLGRPKPWWKWYPAKTAIRRTWPTHWCVGDSKAPFPTRCCRIAFSKRGFGMRKNTSACQSSMETQVFSNVFFCVWTQNQMRPSPVDLWLLGDMTSKLFGGGTVNDHNWRIFFFSLLLYIHKKVCCSWCKMSIDSF